MTTIDAVVQWLVVVLGGVGLVLVVAYLGALAWYTRSWPHPHRDAPMGRVKPRQEHR